MDGDDESVAPRGMWRRLIDGYSGHTAVYSTCAQYANAAYRAARRMRCTHANWVVLLTTLFFKGLFSFPEGDQYTVGNVES